MARKVRPITDLPGDLYAKVEKAVAESASHMIFGLQSAGPWWTGHFAQSWVVSSSPVQPTDSSRFKEDRDKQLPSQFNDRPNNNAVDCNPPGSKAQRISGGDDGTPMDQTFYPVQTNRVPGRPEVLTRSLKNPIYIGNKASYAGFVINRPGATMPDTAGNPVTYEQHKKGTKGRRGHTLTSRDNNPNWIKVYLAHDGFVNNDINMGFQSVGFKTK
tara:strand:- start:36 stop:680 length:645 start_codon:yes stop_codon:yes gene_type:complete